jgi:hypothetical protein
MPINRPISSGTEKYRLGTHPVSGAGYGFSEKEFEFAITGSVASTVFDDHGNASVEDFLLSLNTTGFVADSVNRILHQFSPPENWRVGEAFAETYLVHHRNCIFPWSDSRDERRQGSSLPGADLIGFQIEGKSCRFAFGEVKTSNQKKYPPNVLYGRSGMTAQLEDLCSSRNTRDNLVKYLIFREKSLSMDDVSRLRLAGLQYLENPDNCTIFGVLIRDVEPLQDDLRTRVGFFVAAKYPEEMVIELIAIYLPAEQIDALSDTVQRAKGGAV